MPRREADRIATAAGVAGTVRFEVYGAGPNLLLGYPIPAKRDGPTAEQFWELRDAYVDRLEDRYRVIVLDYPPSQLFGSAAPFTAETVCADYLAVADAAGADRFAYYGFSWGGVVGLQLAARTNRLTALVCGGWPPLRAPYSSMLAVVNVAAADGGPQAGLARLMIPFYQSIQDWPERDAVSRFACPRMTFAGTSDVITGFGQTVRIGPLIAEHRAELERLGWTVRLVDGAEHDLVGKPDVVVPLIRAFLDPLLLAE